jgi:hypothetical protein
MTQRITPALTAIVLGLVAVAILVACYLGSWWIFADSTRRTGEIRRDTFEFQQGSVDAAQQKVTEIKRIDSQLANATTDDQRSALTDQRAAIVAQTCPLIARVNGSLPSDLTTFQAKECS